jgi:hypothetical protein
MRRPMRRALVLAGVVAAVLSAPATAIAHPLGNFTVNRYAGIELTPDEVRIDYVLDLAEIPPSRSVRRSTLTRTERSPMPNAPPGPLARRPRSSRT